MRFVWNLAHLTCIFIKSSWYENAKSSSIIREISNPEKPQTKSTLCRLEFFVFELSGTLNTFIYGVRRSLANLAAPINHFDTLQVESFEGDGALYANEENIKVRRVEELYCVKCRETHNFKVFSHKKR